ncbi:FAD-binding oxidoreductase [Thiococcus pfennigii]|uniref:FAD-binding oxidoreductase n=1 Tax=Thiococcus pfennigii TaxID=1057 RepID=UPI0019061859|nr:FAD-binding oxidoreductase [Thiococcus pfennigii]MBK1732314.1 oxidoreductase [Thiococcus pfennigii]
MREARQIGEFANQLRGHLIQPEDPAYESARRIYNGMIDKRPALIARCADVADVMRAIRFARDNDVTLALRSGGHNGAGLSLCDDGLVVDLSSQKGIRVDPQARTVRVEPGCTWGDVDHATHAFGLATVSGIISTTGVAGLTLGGGHGYLSRQYGLTIDNLLEADVALADGSLVRASAEEHPDLFWALRGGGGNFGVVTSFLLRLHPVAMVQAGPAFWSMDDAEVILKWYREFMPRAPRELYGFFAFLEVPPSPLFPSGLHGRRVCSVLWCYSGPPERADEVLAQVRGVHDPLFEHIDTVPYPLLQGLFDQFYPPGLQWYWKGDFVNEIPDEAVDKHGRHARGLPTPLSTMHLYPIDGVVQQVASDATAFAYRDCQWSSLIAGVAEDPADGDRVRDWARGYWQDLHPYSAGGSYVNFLEEEGEARVRSAYRGNYERLVDVKTQYDPDNLFRRNQNIPPR